MICGADVLWECRLRKVIGKFIGEEKEICGVGI